MNHANRSVAGRQSRALAEKIMSAIAGKVSAQFGPNRLKWDSLKKKSRIYFGDQFIPCEKLIENLTQHEVDELENLPFWNGNNGWEISTTCFRLVGAAIKRYVGPDESTQWPTEVLLNELWICQCCNCKIMRADREQRLDNLGDIS